MCWADLLRQAKPAHVYGKGPKALSTLLNIFQDISKLFKELCNILTCGTSGLLSGTLEAFQCCMESPQGSYEPSQGPQETLTGHLTFIQ